MVDCVECEKLEKRIVEIEENEKRNKEITEKILLTLSVQNKTNTLQTKYLKSLSDRMAKVERFIIRLNEMSEVKE